MTICRTICDPRLASPMPKSCCSISSTAATSSRSPPWRALADRRPRRCFMRPRRPFGQTYRRNGPHCSRLFQTQTALKSSSRALQMGITTFILCGARLKRGEFMPVFLPWSLASEYRTKPGDDFKITGEEAKLAELHGLDAAQITWRRAKISQLGSEEYFAQEYPLHAAEAFISSQFDSFIPAELVLCARKEQIEPYGPLIVGVDPAAMGADRTSIAWRQGHVITKVESRRGLDTMETTGWVARIIREDRPAKVNIDVGGLGIGIYDRLIEQGHSRSLINAVNFGGKPLEPPPIDETGKPGGGPANRRAE